MSHAATPANENELVISRVLNAPRDKVFRAWTDPEVMMQWFAPHPWTTVRAEVDVRPGGASLVVMRSPDGQDCPCPGMYLEVVKNERLVFTDAYIGDWQPSAKPFMTVVLTFEDAGDGKTLYTARARHWSQEDRATHEKMGFHEGWMQCAGQLEEVAASL